LRRRRQPDGCGRTDRQRGGELEDQGLAGGVELGEATGQLRGDAGIERLASLQHQRIEAGAGEPQRHHGRIGRWLRGGTGQLRDDGGKL
jgi:hypothetical protein